MNIRAATLSVLVLGAGYPGSLALGETPDTASASDTIKTIGNGVIRICLDWNLLEKSCRKYHHVKLPSSVSVGDTIPVQYGSNLKSYRFRVGRIIRADGVCTLRQPIGTAPRDRIKVSCEPGP